MFYVLSKILGLFVNPVFWIVTLLLSSLIVKRKPLKKKFLITGISLLLFFSNAFILNEFLKAFESFETPKSELKEKYTYGIVLSGMTYYDTEHQRVNFLRSSDRIWQALKLYKEKRISKILITGGAAHYFNKDTVESAVLRDFLVSIGVPKHDIVTEELARNTRENALYTKELIHQTDTLLLITSATHMRRAYKCFKKVGLECDTFGTDFQSGARQWNIEALFVPQADVLIKWNAFIHELVGLFIYKAMGYI